MARNSTGIIGSIRRIAAAALGIRPTMTRMYAGAAAHRSMSSRPTTTITSADAEIRTSLTALRSRSRGLIRDSAYAKRARTIVVNNVIGSGIGMQAQVRATRGTKLVPKINTAIEEAFEDWQRADSCHTGGTLHMADFERQMMGQVFEAGEVFVRFHQSAFGASEIPLAMELIESERCPETIQPDMGFVAPNTRMGIEIDRYYRPLRYWIRDQHRGELYFPTGSETVSVYPASEILHLRIVDRWPQTRGVPWLHTAIQKLNDMDGYTEAEIIAARAAANYVGAREEDEWTTGTEKQADGTLQTHLEPGLLLRGKYTFFAPNRPNSALDPFMRYMLREVASGTNVSYEALSRDYSQSNYSSSRLSLLDDRDTWRMLQMWFLRTFRAELHRRWIQAAVLARAIPVGVEEYALNPKRFEAVKFKPRGWSWVDPTKEVDAYKEAIKAGLTTRTHVIASTADGRDIEDMDEERKQELESAAALGLEFDTDPGADEPKVVKQTPKADDAKSDDDDDEKTEEPERGLRVIR